MAKARFVSVEYSGFCFLKGVYAPESFKQGVVSFLHTEGYAVKAAVKQGFKLVKINRTGVGLDSTFGAFEPKAALAR